MIHSLSNVWTNSGLCACGLNFKSVNGILAWRRWFLQGSTTYALIYFGQSTWKDGDGSGCWSAELVHIILSLLFFK